ncbi:hypothetical protein DPMN_117905 [Dreissena polymorpha]|uniref:Uncharacterized protein n=1 Tax=Dreissena polymorpha TaxID=45954 RepID=A0A9D4GJ62_DREPO|nr:hypothetical protein DPMN_117905 [Dreissena polymorpha]
MRCTFTRTQRGSGRKPQWSSGSRSTSRRWRCRRLPLHALPASSEPLPGDSGARLTAPTPICWYLLVSVDFKLACVNPQF